MNKYVNVVTEDRRIENAENRNTKIAKDIVGGGCFVDATGTRGVLHFCPYMEATRRPNKQRLVA